MLMQSITTTNIDFFFGLAGQIASAASTGKEVSQGGLNFMLSVVQGIEPRD
ncbi:MAG TPA: hypothetical protein VMO78_14670 [Rhizomicrobium sp.]|nr:hypothetical protein [Rhizomicrobium sp.]